jgi:hypothetical protein
MGKARGMRKTVVGILVLIVLLVAIPAAASIGTDNDQVKAVASPILDNLLAGFNKGNYAQYSKDFDDTLREAIPEKNFSRCGRTSSRNWGPSRARSTWVFSINRLTPWCSGRALLPAPKMMFSSSWCYPGVRIRSWWQACGFNEVIR